MFIDPSFHIRLHFKCCLTQWISKLPGSFEIHWVRQYLVNSMGVAGIVNSTVYKTEQVLGMANCPNFERYAIYLLVRTHHMWASSAPWLFKNPWQSFLITNCRFNVLQRSTGIDQLDGIRWELLACLVAAWLLVFLCLLKGVKTSGKVSGLRWWRHQMETFSALMTLCARNSPVTGDLPHKGQCRGALMFPLICAWTNGWVNNRDSGDLRRHLAHYDVTVMWQY